MKGSLSQVFVVVSAMLLAPASMLGQSVAPVFAPDKMDSILYGAAYYAEYMPYERLDQERRNDAEGGH